MIKRYFPILDWGRHYTAGTFVTDGLAAIIVTIMLIPQSLAYALLAGLATQSESVMDYEQRVSLLMLIVLILSIQ